MHPFRPLHSRRLGATVVAAIAASTVLGACSAPAPRPCDELRPGTSTRALMLLTDGRSPALDAAIAAIAEDPAAAFSSETLGFDANDGQDAAGTVVLATFDAAGAIVPHGRFDLGGSGSDPTRRKVDAQRQASCLETAAAALPQGKGGDLLRTLAPATETIAAAGPDGAALIAVGLGRSSIEDQALAETDLSKTGQAQVFAALDEVSLVPDLSVEKVAVRFLAPSEGVSSAISAAGIDSFANALCTQTAASACTAGTTLS